MNPFTRPSLLACWTPGRLAAALAFSVTAAVVSGLGCETANISSGAVVPNVFGSTPGVNLYTGESNFTTGYVEMKFNGVPTGLEAYGLLVRVDDTGPTPDGYVCVITPADIDGDTVDEIAVTVGDLENDMTPTAAYADIAIGDASTHALGCEVTSTGKIRVYVDGDLKYTYTIGSDPADPGIASGKIGFLVGESGISIDDFKYYSRRP